MMDSFLIELNSVHHAGSDQATMNFVEIIGILVIIAVVLLIGMIFAIPVPCLWLLFSYSTFSYSCDFHRLSMVDNGFSDQAGSGWRDASRNYIST
jgi:hypothetical protein